MTDNSQNNVVFEKSKCFALRIIKLYKFLGEEKAEYVISKQILRCGTSIGANIAESVYAQSRSDFVGKLSISLKEAAETGYWLDILYKSNYINKSSYDSVRKDCDELMKILTSIVRTTKNSAKQQN